jgi:hypothetical protein
MSKQVFNEGITTKIKCLSFAGVIPRETAMQLKTIMEMRNVSEYKSKKLFFKAIQASWDTIKEWAEANNYPI